MTPTTKSNRPAGYRPVNRIANQVSNTATITTIESTM